MKRCRYLLHDYIQSRPPPHSHVLSSFLQTLRDIQEATVVAAAGADAAADPLAGALVLGRGTKLSVWVALAVPFVS